MAEKTFRDLYEEEKKKPTAALEKPRAFDPRRRAVLPPSGKKSLTLYGKIKMTPGKIPFRGLFCSFGIRLDQRFKPKHLKS